MNKESNLSAKHKFQDWLRKPSYSYMVTVQCDKKNQMSDTELNQRLRIFDFKLCKKYLVNKFTKCPLQNRFWCIGFIELSKGNYCNWIEYEGLQKLYPEYKKDDGGLHQHILVFAPDKNSTSFASGLSPLEINRSIKNDLKVLWYSIPSLHPNGFKREIKEPHILKIDRKRNNSVVTYASKQTQSKNLDNINFPFDKYDHRTTDLFV